MEKYIWIIHFIDQYEVMAADNMKTALAIMKEYVENTSEFNTPLKENSDKTVKQLVLEELEASYTECLEAEWDSFGSEDVCYAEQVPLYTHFKNS